MIGRIAKPWPANHGIGIHHAASKHAMSNDIVPGSLIEVDGPWPPAYNWKCGTPVVWRCADSRVPFDVYLCVHQIIFEPLSAEADIIAESNHVEVNK